MTRQRQIAWHEAAGNAVVSSVAGVLVAGLRTVWTYPAQTTLTLALAAGFTFGLNNALWQQPMRHPAPYFTQSAALTQPTAPVPRQYRPAASVRPLAPWPAPETVAPVHASEQMPALTPVGNADVALAQQKLQAMGLFAGKIDGYYGPQTANAIRAFETQTGLEPKGALTPSVLEAIGTYRVAAATTSVPRPLPAPRDLQPIPAPMPEQPVQALAKDDPVLEIAMTAADTTPQAETPTALSVDATTIRKVQTGLARLGFLTSDISGTFDEGTARAIREFEIYNNYKATGALSPELIDLLRRAGAYN